MKRIVLSADLGGTNLRIAAVDEDGQVLQPLRVPTPTSLSRADIVSAICDLASQCCSLLGSDARPIAFGVAAPATVSSADGLVFNSPNLPDLNGVNLSALIEECSGLTVLIENDANAAAIGEHWLGASHGSKNSICVTLGTGVGGGLILDGVLIQGVDGTAGEIGHVIVEPNGLPCGCGSFGCLEQYSSATAITRMAASLRGKFPDSSVLRHERPSAADIYEAGKGGDAMALEIFRHAGTYLGIALAGLVNVLNPEVIVVGGGVAAAWDLLIVPVQDQIRKRAFRQPAERVKIFRAQLGDDAGILGAAKLAFESKNA